MKQFKVILLSVFLLFPVLAFSQLYNPLNYNAFVINRPAGLNWQEIHTDHFRIIFPDGEDSLAYRSAAILESHYSEANKLTGGSLQHFPVILTNYNDLSNGFVNSVNFRSEVDLASIKGKGMNPQSGDWLETVLPHELIHAAHFNVQIPWEEKKLSIPNLVSVISPDLARTFHGYPPVGFHEGLAVYYETESVAPMGGRGNYTSSTNRFNSNFGSNDRWNMGQTLTPSDYSQPFNRHYISGYSFVDWLHNEYGDDISKDAIRYHYHNFFLGYGFTLRQKTGNWPGKLYRLYEEDLKEYEQNRRSQVVKNTTEYSEILDTPFSGEEAHAPKWIDESRLLFYGSFYNGRVGFYSYDLRTGSFKMIKETFGVSDFNYEIGNGDLLFFSSYYRDPLYSGTYKTDLRTIDLNTGEAERLTKEARIYAPTSNGERLLALQTLGSGAQIVEVFEGGETKVLKTFQDALPVSLQFNPNDANELAVIINQRGVQALWITKLNSISEDLDHEPTLAFRNASIHDPEWHPTANKIMFTMDASPAMNVYELDLDTKEIVQLTSSLYNAFEASYSPDGHQIAYVVQNVNERKIAILDRADFLNRRVSDSALLTGTELQKELKRPLLGSDLMDSVTRNEKSSYKGDLKWLKPRVIFPIVQEKAGTYQSGVSISSIDPLSSQAYSVELTGIQNRAWYDVTYTNKSFYPGARISIYSEPQFFPLQNANETFSLMRQDRGLGVSIPFSYTFRSDTRFSGISFEPEFKIEQFKYYDLQANELTDFFNRYRAGFYSQLSLGILNLPRDVQPSSGISFFGLFEQTFKEQQVSVPTPIGTYEPSNRTLWSAYYGAFGYVSPLRKLNQSLRLDVRILSQSISPIYSNDTIIPLGFSEDIFPNFIDQQRAFRNIGRFSTRYTIPLFYPDNGMLTVPLYLSSIYLTAFSHTLTDMDSNNLVESSRSIFGAGLHLQFKVSNLLFDFGVGLAYEPTRENTQFIIGQF